MTILTNSQRDIFRQEVGHPADVFFSQKRGSNGGSLRRIARGISSRSPCGIRVRSEAMDEDNTNNPNTISDAIQIVYPDYLTLLHPCRAGTQSRLRGQVRIGIAAPGRYASETEYAWSAGHRGLPSRVKISRARGILTQNASHLAMPIRLCKSSRDPGRSSRSETAQSLAEVEGAQAEHDR